MIKNSNTKTSSVGNKILSIFTLLILLVTVFLSTFSFLKSRSALLETTKGNLSTRIVEGSKLVSNIFDTKFKELEYISTLDEIQSMNWEIQYPELVKQAEIWGFKHIFIMDINGTSYYAENNTIKDQSQEDFFKNITGNKKVVTEPFVDNNNQLSIVTLTAPIINASGSVIGNICGVVDLYNINSIIQDINVGKAGYAFILNENGNFVAHKDMSLVYNHICLSDLSSEYSGLNGLKPAIQKTISSETGNDTFIVNNEKMIMSYIPIESTPWSLFLAIPEKELLKSNNKALYLQVFVSILAVIIGIICSLYLRKWISNKLKEITKMSSELSDCNLSYTSETSGNDEFAEVISSLNNSVSVLKSTIEEVNNNSTVLSDNSSHKIGRAHV